MDVEVHLPKGACGVLRRQTQRLETGGQSVCGERPAPRHRVDQRGRGGVGLNHEGGVVAQLGDELVSESQVRAESRREQNSQLAGRRRIR